MMSPLQGMTRAAGFLVRDPGCPWCYGVHSARDAKVDRTEVRAMPDQQSIEERPPRPGEADTVYKVEGERRLPVPEPAQAARTWECAGQRIDYTVRAAHIDVHSDTGTLIGKMFSLTYLAAEPEWAQRPVTFCFNGGPGSASVPVNVGGIGPVRVATDGTHHLASPAQLEDNPSTLLRVSVPPFAFGGRGAGPRQVRHPLHRACALGAPGDRDALRRCGRLLRCRGAGVERGFPPASAGYRLPGRAHLPAEQLREHWYVLGPLARVVRFWDARRCAQRGL